jgi:hypothetical protein
MSATVQDKIDVKVSPIVGDGEARMYLKDQLAREGVRVDPKTVIAGRFYRVNFYKITREGDHISDTWKMVDSLFVEVVKTASGLEHIVHTGEKS